MYCVDEITRFVELVVETTNPDKIILFGSYAYGTPTDDSDLDLLVIKNGKDFTYDYEAELSALVYFKRKQMNISTRYDILFCTDRQINHTLENSNAIADALKKGRVMYERAN